jgi:hypothetical protein
MIAHNMKGNVVVGDLISDKYIPLDDAKETIIAVLNQFNPDLGTRAAEILYNEERLNIVENPSQKTGMMQCRPAGLTEEHLKANDMYFSDYKERFGPSFTEQENSEDFAIIDYEYDGTQNSVVYLAHELGHAIADEIQNERGKDFSDFTPAQAEEQAYFIQNIYSHYTGHPSTESACLDDANKGKLKASWTRVNQYGNAQVKFEKALSMGIEDRETLIEEALAGGIEIQDKTNIKKELSPQFVSP